MLLTGASLTLSALDERIRLLLVGRELRWLPLCRAESDLLTPIRPRT